MVAILVLLTIIGFLTVDYVAQRRAARQVATPGAHGPRLFAGRIPSPVPVSGDPADLLALPRGVFIAPGHTWLQLELGGGVRVGAGRLPVTALGTVDRLTLLQVGSRVRRGQPLAVLHRGDRKLRLRSPVDGRIEAVNSRLQTDAHALHDNPFGVHWLYRIEPSRLAESLRRLFVAEEAKDWMRREVIRFRDFLGGLGGRRMAPAVTLPDGGLPVDGLAALIGDDEWRDLTEAFFGEGDEDVEAPE